MKVFIGSATRLKGEVERITGWLERLGFECLPWYTAFPAGEYTLDRLLDLSHEVDAAILVFGEDDPVTHPQRERRQPRDNVLIEFGLFAKALGRRNAIICRCGNPRQPGNLAGLTYIDLGSRRARQSVQQWAERLRTAQAEPYDVPMWSGRGKMQVSLEAHIARAASSLFFVGVSFETVLKDLGEPIVASLRDRGVNVKLLLLHPASGHVAAHQEFAGRDLEARIVESIEQRLKRLFEKLDARARERLDVRATYYLPRFAARVFDDETMLLNHYLFDRRAHVNPVLELRRHRQRRVFDIVAAGLKSMFDYGLTAKTRGAATPNVRIIDRGVWLWPGTRHRHDAWTGSRTAAARLSTAHRSTRSAKRLPKVDSRRS